MIYEATINYVTVDNNGNDKGVNEKYIIENAETFTEVETVLTEMYGNLTCFDVAAIKRSKLKEILNECATETDCVYIATLQDTFVDDEGNEKYTEYQVALFADSMDDAYAKTKEHVRQGYDLTIVGIKKTRFVGVI